LVVFLYVAKLSVCSCCWPVGVASCKLLVAVAAGIGFSWLHAPLACKSVGHFLPALDVNGSKLQLEQSN